MSLALAIGPEWRSGAPAGAALDDLAAARAFYGDALGGRQVWRAERREAPVSVWFLVGGTLVEVRPGIQPGETTMIRLRVADPCALAARCWDAGFTVRVDQAATGPATVSVIDPFGRRVELAHRASPAWPCDSGRE